MRRIFSEDFTLTKRHLGLILSTMGLLILVGLVGMEIWGGNDNGFGAVQKMGALLGLISLVVGLTLLPLGNQPA